MSGEDNEPYVFRILDAMGVGKYDKSVKKSKMLAAPPMGGKI